MKTTTSVPVALLGIVLGLSTATASARDTPKPYKVVSLPDGRLEITVNGKAGFPDGSQVKTINLREKLEAAASRECPYGYDLESDNASRIGLAPNGQGFIATQKGLVRCKAQINTSDAH